MRQVKLFYEAMRTNLKLVLLVIAMSFSMLLGIFLSHLYRFEKSHKKEFLSDRASFGEQVANIALSGLQISNYFELSRLSTGLFKKDEMAYLAILDERGLPVHLSTEKDVFEIESFRVAVATRAIHESLVLGAEKVAVLRSDVRDDTGKYWGAVEIAYYWKTAYGNFLRQLNSVFFFFLLFIPAWTAVLLYNTRAILRPLDEFVSNLKKIGTEWPIPLEDFDARLAPRKSSPELKVLLDVLKNSLKKLIASQEAHQREASFSALGKQAAQVAHDIRSPLAAMDSLNKDISSLPEEKRRLLRSAIDRIRDIANDLIERNRSLPFREDGGAPAPKEQEAPLSACLISSLIESIVSEKRLQFRGKIGVRIDSCFGRDSYGLFAKVRPSELKRALSNLLNNSVEAMDREGYATVSLDREGDEAVIRVRDDGKGIPPGILAKIGKRGETHGKTGGSGLGVHYAKTVTESWNGTFSLSSSTGKGTEAEIRLPRAEAPAWFMPEISIEKGGTLVILDDDSSIHQIWRGRLESLSSGRGGITAVHLSSSADLRAWMNENTGAANTALFLLDYELADTFETGLSLAAEFSLQKRAVLATSRYEEPDIIASCLNMGIRIIPKGLAGLVPIRIRPGTPAVKALTVLIDDDALTRMTWKTSAETRGEPVRIFPSAADFFSAELEISKDSRIYIDSELGDGEKGEEVALRLRAAGYKNIRLATGHAPEAFAHLPWLTVTGKEPPWK